MIGIFLSSDSEQEDNIVNNIKENIVLISLYLFTKNAPKQDDFYKHVYMAHLLIQLNKVIKIKENKQNVSIDNYMK